MMRRKNIMFQLINPIRHQSWDVLLARSGDNSFFHTSGWAKVLALTYHYEPFYLASLIGERLSLLIPMMEIRSPFTGSRAVSLPFTDQCPPFFIDITMVPDAIRHSMELGRHRAWRYVELRDGVYGSPGKCHWSTYLSHDISLEESESELFGRLESSNRRNIHAASRAPLDITFGKSWAYMQKFYRLHCMTRKRHGLPPQPLRFFQNVYDHIISHDLGIIGIADFKGVPIAASIYFYFGTNAIFKYGASRRKFQGLRPNNLLMWEAIRWLKAKGMTALSLGRTEQDNAGLLRYKRAWGGTEILLRYFRLDMGANCLVPSNRRLDPTINKILRHMPLPILRVLGRMFYKHAG